MTHSHRGLRQLRRAATLILIVLFCAAGQSQPRAPQSQPAFAEPSLSPDGSELAFVSGGDIWTAPAAGGDAHLIVSHAATESRPLYSPDGGKLAFGSTRTGNGDIYILTIDNGELKRLTFDDANDQLDGWSSDGRWIYFSSSSRDNGGTDVYRVSSDGGTPMQVSANLYTFEYFGAPKRDGSAVAFAGHGFGSSQWWRKGHSHIDESEIWLMKFGAQPTYEQLSEGGAKEVWPMWSKDDRTVYYMSDRSGAQNIWAKEIGGRTRQVSQFKDGRVLWPSIGHDGRTIVFERNFQVWKLDVASGRASAVNINRRGASAGPAVEHLRLSDQISEMALAPDGKKSRFHRARRNLCSFQHRWRRRGPRDFHRSRGITTEMVAR
jgi:Tol biopolymer transport system component